MTGKTFLRGIGINPSPLGCAVADLIDDWLGGMHNCQKVREVDWTNPLYIQLRWQGNLATFDGSSLTRLVFLAHDRAIRVEIYPCSNRSVNILFHKRKRDGGLCKRHPTLADAVALHRQRFPLEE